MPAIVDHTARFEAIRDALFEITLRRGAVGFTLPEVAEEMRIGVSTLKRTVTGTSALPGLLVDYAHRLLRWQVLFSHRVPTGSHDEPWSPQLRALLAHLPSDEDARQVFEVWEVATLTHAGTLEQARTSRAARDDWLGTAVQDLVAALEEADAPRQPDAQVLAALVDGLRPAVVAERITPQDAAAVVERHVHGLLATPGDLSPP